MFPGIADPVSFLTHGLGALIFAVLGVGLVRRGRRSPSGRLRAITLTIFVAAAVLLLLASAMFHLQAHGSRARDIFQRIDHAMIFVLIAATFTPLHVVLFQGPLRWGVLLFVWVFAVAGIALKTVFFDVTPEAVSILTYLGMGWVGLISMIALWRTRGFRYSTPIVLGALAYTIGAIFELTNRPILVRGLIESHELLHIFVLLGLGSFWWFMRRIATYSPPTPFRWRPGRAKAARGLAAG